MARDNRGYMIEFNVGRHYFDRTFPEAEKALDLVNGLDERGIDYSIHTGSHFPGQKVGSLGHLINRENLQEFCETEKSL